MRIGEMLVSAGLLKSEQVDEILKRQRCHPEPFGLVAQRLYNLDPVDIERIWTDTTIRISRSVRPASDEIDRNAIDLITRRQAWQFRFLPIRMDGTGTLIAATTASHLSRAVRFATRILDCPCTMMLTDAEYLAANLEAYYQLPGLDARSVHENALEPTSMRGESAA